MSQSFENDGETIETPGMVRWFNQSHYFLKRIGTKHSVVKPDTFVLGLENRFGDNSYSYSCGIEFDNSEAPDLMDRIAEFNGLPAYSDLMATREKLETLLEAMQGPLYASGANKQIVIREIKKALGK